jgi:hypothetical protein
MLNDYSRESLLEFLDYLADKGLGNKNTIVARKAACNKMLSILDGNEASDLRKIDLDQIATQFANLEGSKYTPESLQVYRSRVGRSLNDFFRYKENPANFRMSGSSSTPKTPSRTVRTSSSAIDGGAQMSVAQDSATKSGSVDTLNIPIALRPGCVIQLNGIPVDMTAAEARKIANVVIAMASEDTE